MAHNAAHRAQEPSDQDSNLESFTETTESVSESVSRDERSSSSVPTTLDDKWLRPEPSANDAPGGSVPVEPGSGGTSSISSASPAPTPVHSGGPMGAPESDPEPDAPGESTSSASATPEPQAADATGDADSAGAAAPGAAGAARSDQKPGAGSADPGGAPSATDNVDPRFLRPPSATDPTAARPDLNATPTGFGTDPRLGGPAAGKTADPWASPAAGASSLPAGVPTARSARPSPSTEPTAPAAATAPAADAGAKAAPAAAGALGAADALKRDPNAGAAGKMGKAAAAAGGVKGAVDGFNKGGFKGAAAGAALGAKKGSSQANSLAAAAQAPNGAPAKGEPSAAPGAPASTSSSDKNAKLKMAGSATKAAAIAGLTSVTGVAPGVWAALLSPKALAFYAAAITLPLLLVAGLLLGPGGIAPAPEKKSDDLVAEYFPPGWQDLLRDAAEDTRPTAMAVPWTLLGGIAKSTTDFGRTSPYDQPPIDHDKERGTSVKDSPDPTAVPVGGGIGVPVGGPTVPIPPGNCPTSNIGNYPNGQIPAAALCGLSVGDGQMLRSDAAAAFEVMSQQYNAQFGAPICVTDSYRPLADQIRLKKTKGNLAATPGTSRHGLGRALDLCGGVNRFGTPQHEWLAANAPRFGWFHPEWARQGGSKPEAWHFEFKDVATPAIGPSASAAGTFASSVSLLAASDCEARLPDPGIGGEEGQGKGPFLLSPAAVERFERSGRDANNPCDVAPWLVDQLSEVAMDRLDDGDIDPWLEEQVRDGDNYTENEDVKRFWASVVTDSGLIAQEGANGLGECTVAPAPDGTSYPMAYLIEQIWTCEAGTSTKPLHLVTDVTGIGSSLKYEEASADAALSTLIAEANQASFNFSAWKTEDCDNGADLAGIFPLSAALAAKHGAADRCDVQSNIRAAARAVMEVERTVPAKRASADGPYQPMMGGWATMPAVFGAEAGDLAQRGPALTWSPSESCMTTIGTFLDTAGASTQLSAFVPLAADGAEPGEAHTRAHTALLGALRSSGPLADPTCAGAPEAEFYEQLSVQARIASEQVAESVPTEASLPGVDGVPAVDQAGPDAPTLARINGLTGLSVYYGYASAQATPAAAEFGKDSVVGPRLALTSASVRVGDISAARLSTAITSTSQASVDYAIFYGGLTAPFGTALQRTGSLLSTGGAAGVGGAAGGLGGNIPPELVPLFMAHGSKCEGLSPALLAAQAKAESGFNPRAVSPVGARGLTQFMPATWASSGIDGDGDGVADPFNPADSIASQAKYMCAMLDQVKKSGIPGDPLDLALASYNAGFGNVKKYNGVPPFRETQNYIPKIRNLMGQFAAPAAIGVGASGPVDASGCPTAPPASRIAGKQVLRGGAESVGIAEICARAVAQARTPQAATAIKYALNHIGMPYSQPKRNSDGYYDCSSFVSRAYQSAGVNIAPPGQNAPVTGTFRSARWSVKVSRSDLKPGDWWQPFPGHVVMVLADGWMVHTNRTGDVSHVKKLPATFYQGGYIDPSRV